MAASRVITSVFSLKIKAITVHRFIPIGRMKISAFYAREGCRKAPISLSFLSKQPDDLTINPIARLLSRSLPQLNYLELADSRATVHTCNGR